MSPYGELPDRRDPFVEGLRRSLRERHLVSRGHCVLVACSGGADSTALAAALRVLKDPLGFTLALGHVNHRIRGDEADGDARWVIEFARFLGVQCYVGSIDIPLLRAHRGGSLEDVARRARRSLLESIGRTAGADVMATAHHADDQAETVLMHAMRGSGLPGIAGMTWGPRDGIVRPLLGISRQEIRDALERWHMPWREDSSNETLEHDRNRVRHELLPLLRREWNPQIGRALSRLAEAAALDNEALDDVVERLWPSAVIRQSNQAIVLDCIVIREYPMSIRRRVVRRAAIGLSSVGDALTYAETERLAALTMGRGRVVLRGRLTAWSDRERLRCESADAWRGPEEISLDGTTLVPGWGAIRVEAGGRGRAVGPNMLRWPRERIDAPLEIRRWRPGDRVATRGGGSSATVADVARGLGRPVDPRELLIIADRSRIIWAVGMAKARPPRVSPGAPMVVLHWEQME